MPHTPGGTKCVLRVGGEPKKTAGPTLPGAASCRTLQEGPNLCCGLVVSPRKPRVHTARSGQGPHTPGRTKCTCGLAVSPENRGSHIARSAQEPHTPGGTKRVLWVDIVPSSPSKGQVGSRPRRARRHSPCRKQLRLWRKRRRT